MSRPICAPPRNRDIPPPGTGSFPAADRAPTLPEAGRILTKSLFIFNIYFPSRVNVDGRTVLPRRLYPRLVQQGLARHGPSFPGPAKETHMAFRKILTRASLAFRGSLHGRREQEIQMVNCSSVDSWPGSRPTTTRFPISPPTRRPRSRWGARQPRAQARRTALAGLSRPWPERRQRYPSVLRSACPKASLRSSFPAGPPRTRTNPNSSPSWRERRRP